MYDLPPGTDLVKFQAQQAKKNAQLRKKIMANMFGCSNDPRYKDEILP
ncbi:MAG: hypothetical protein P4M08_04410 [Oligoflexia bacterium]|nr:hypothetical protein [Oligoflexia bacterium]